MWDDPETPRSSRIRRPSVTHLLIFALVLSLGGLAYLLLRPDVRALVFSSGSRQAQPLASPSGVSVQHGTAGQSAKDTQSSLTAQYGSQIVGSSPAVGTSATQPPDLDTMMAQLEQMQRGLLAATNQLEQKSFAARVLPSAASAQPASGVLGQPVAARDDLSSTLAEIEQLYQVMQPLMAQIEVASRSSRSPGEIDAMRAQMAAIHQRLSDLVVRVEAAKTGSRAPTASGAGPVAANLSGHCDGRPTRRRSAHL